MEPETLIANRFRVDRRIGKGGMGEVFAATNVQTNEVVALKLLRAEVKTRRVSMERFRREARAGGFIKSTYVTEILEVDQDPERGIVLVFELLSGESLIQRLKRTGPIGFPELWSIVECIWMGLHDAHTAGIIHRDLKPSNVFLTPRDGDLPPEVKILDFGISKLPREVIVETLTRVGQSLGTFSFMPPEQIGKAKEVDHRADIYSAATLIFQSMSGQLPYNARSAVQIMDLKKRQEPRRLSEVMKIPISSALDDFVAKGLARDPDARFQSAREALDTWRTLRPAEAISDLEIRPREVSPDSSITNDTVPIKTKVYQAVPAAVSSAPAATPSAPAATPSAPATAPSAPAAAPSEPAAAPSEPAAAPSEPAAAPSALAAPQQGGSPANNSWGSSSQNITTKIFKRRPDGSRPLISLVIYALTALLLMGLGYGTVSFLIKTLR